MLIRKSCYLIKNKVLGGENHVVMEFKTKRRNYLSTSDQFTYISSAYKKLNTVVKFAKMLKIYFTTD